MDVHTVTATSALLKDRGIDHIVLADGRILVEASRESSRAAVRAWRKSPEYKEYKRLQAKHGPKGTGKIGIKGGYSLKKNAQGVYKLVKLTPEAIKSLKKRAKAQRNSSHMKGGEGGRHVEPKKGAKKVAKVAPKVTKPAAKPAKKVAKPAPKVAPKKVAPKKVAKPVAKKAGKKSRD